ncbi:MAG TPA: hypothetical protein VFG37_07250 [Planctomycetota bacterium]|jgi:hypothetical protein|nr:hypothetical protein [Planctomycetota bacterium]
MFSIRNVGALLRGSATPFQIHVACWLGALLGFTPGIARAPALVLALFALLVVLNANLFVAGLIGGLSHLAALATMPVAFAMGRFLLDGPTRGFFTRVINAPVGAWCGLEYYVCAGGVVLGLVVGIASGFLLCLPLKAFRAAMGKVESGSGFYSRHKDKAVMRFLFWVLFGKKHKLDTYSEITARRVGNPIRISGVVVVAILIGGVVFAQGFLLGPLLTRELKSGLEAANGATVDVAGVDLDFGNSRLTVRGLALCDKQALDHDLFRAALVEGDLSGTDLLRKRLKIDRLVAKEARHGAPRATPGVLVTPSTEPSPSPAPEGESKTLDDYLADAKVWQERLKQGREWLEKLKSRPRGPAGAPPDDATLKERLEKEVAAKGWRDVAATHLIEGAPALQIGEVVAEGIQSDSLGKKIDLRIENLSTDPGLVDGAPRVTIRTQDGACAIDASLGSEARVPGQSFLDLKLAGLATDDVVSKFAGKLGHAPAHGGTLDAGFRLGWGAGQAAAFDNPLNVVLKDTTVELPKLGATQVKELAVPLSLKGPLDNPRVSVDMKAFADNLAKAGAGELANKLKSELAEKGDALKKEATRAAGSAVDKAKAGDVKGLEDDAKHLPGDLKDLNPFGKKKKKDEKKPPEPKPDENKPAGGKPDGG